ncbi:hypothetical protein [Corynebacterium casei]|uniref:hypothetical protein n=1 Tax=Corynebacterium casei TaxID=160386 RepID=UPI003FD46AC0
MSKTIQELTALTTPPEYRPSSSFDEAKGSGTFTAPVQGDDLETGNWDSTLQWMGFDPDHFEVVSETVRVSSWQSFSGDQLHAVRATVREHSEERFEQRLGILADKMNLLTSKYGISLAHILELRRDYPEGSPIVPLPPEVAPDLWGLPSRRKK